MQYGNNRLKAYMDHLMSFQTLYSEVLTLLLCVYKVYVNYIQNCTNYTSGNTSFDTCDCEGCLGMSDDNYNLLYAIYAWT